MVELVALEIADAPGVWAGLGFAVDGGVCRIGRVAHRLAGGPGQGIVSWTLDGTRTEPAPTLDGLTTGSGPGPAATATASRHPNGVVAIDHLVVFTPDLERTVAALTEAGCQERRRRRSATYGREMVQAFFRLGEVVLEVVSGARPAGDGPARFFGLAFTVADLDATARHLGDRLHPAKDAVQPGRHIATLDRDAGSTVAMAFMSPGRAEPA
jgi:hypothetical protein